jgi:hypothetical protein
MPFILAGFEHFGLAHPRVHAVALCQQLSRDAEPFRIEWFSANGLTCATIPVGGIALIAFLAMKVGVHPRTIGSFVLLGRFVGLRPIAFGIPPQAGEGLCKLGGRFGLGERLTKIVQGHVEPP